MYKTVVSKCARQSTPALRAGALRNYAAAASAPPFDWQDPLNAKNLLTEEELAISETAEKYCQEQLLPRVLRMPSCPCAYLAAHSYNLSARTVKDYVLISRANLLQRPTVTKTTTAKFSPKWASSAF